MSSLLRRTTLIGAVTVLATTVLVGPAGATGPRGPAADLTYVGGTTIAAGAAFQGTTIGGLSSLSYDATRDVYYALSDDQGAGFTQVSSPARFYTLRIDTSDGSLDPGDVQVLAVTTLLGADGKPFPALSLDPEGLTLTRRHTLVVTSEGIANRRIAPFVREFALSGQQLRDVPVPGYYTPTATSGVRQNLAFEAAAVSRDGQRLFVGMENALLQDGPAASTTQQSPARILRYDVRRGGARREYVYDTDKVVAPSAVFSVNGLVELLPLNDQFLLAMERSFSVGAGNTIRIYRAALPGATNVAGVADIHSVPGLRPVRKSLLLQLPAVVGGQPLDNVEGMTFGPRLPDGRRSVLLVSDNNFTGGQDSQVLLLAVR